MRINLLFSIIFLSLNTLFHLNALQNQGYNNHLDPCLFENDISCFIDSSRDIPDNEYINALWDITKLASINGHSPSNLLEDIHNNLEERINRIESLKNKWDREKFIYGLKFIALGIASSCIIYCLYRTYYYPINKEYKNIKKSLEDRGMKIVTHYTPHFEAGHGFVDPGTTLYVPLGATNYEDAFLELLKLDQKRESIRDKLFNGTVIPLGLFYCGITDVYKSFNLHHNDTDDEYLERYQELLEITKTMQNNYTPKCT